MCEQPLISVIMGAYNCADTINEAIECIIQQTYQNWELIICDDASSDNTYQELCLIAQEDARIILRSEERV